MLRPTLAVLAVVVVASAFAAPAAAHTQVQRATPGPGEVVEGIVEFVLLEFLDPVVPTPTIEVTGPDGRPVEGLAEVSPIADDAARVEFDPLTEAGRYRVDYSFVAVDGDQQRSAYTFTVAADSDGVAFRPLPVGLVGAVLVALVVAALLARRRSAGPGPEHPRPAPGP